jgi:hypothetical protein
MNLNTPHCGDEVIIEDGEEADKKNASMPNIASIFYRLTRTFQIRSLGAGAVNPHRHDVA